MLQVLQNVFTETPIKEHGYRLDLKQNAYCKHDFLVSKPEQAQLITYAQSHLHPGSPSSPPKATATSSTTASPSGSTNAAAASGNPNTAYK